jgi:transcription antitermination factor NusG
VNHWFALLVKPRHEKAVSAALRSKNYEEFLPLRCVRRKWSDRFQAVEMPLLAGYTFCRFEAGDKVNILRTPGVRKVVGWGSAPVPVEEAEIQALQAIMRAGVATAPCPYLRTGQPIRLDGGPLNGLHGLLLESRGHSRLVVSITLLQRSVSVEVDQGWITPTGLTRTRRAAAARGEAASKDSAVLHDLQTK